MKQYPVARIIVPVVILAIALFINYKVSSFYVPAKMAFHDYCEEHHLDYSSYIWVLAKPRVGYSYVDFAPEWGTVPATYRAIVPWIGKPAIEALSTPRQKTNPVTKTTPSPRCVKGYFQNMFAAETPNRVRRLDYIESKLGIKRYDFKFSFPRDKKLLATINVQAEGKAVSEDILGTYEIMPPQNPQQTEQRISICFFSPTYPVNTADQAVCDVNFDGKYAFSLNIPRSALTSTQGEEVRQEPLSSVEPGKDYPAWSYVVRGDGKSEKFRCTLTIRVEPLAKEDEIGKVIKAKP